MQSAVRIKRASRDMNRLFTDLLEYTRTRLVEGMPTDRPACDLGPQCEASLEDIHAGNPEQQFVRWMSGKLTLLADGARMQQAVSSLVADAAQHGNRLAPVTLTADSEADAIVLRVSNLCDPIAPDALRSIFEPLVQTPSANSELHERSRTGLGLGLFIVREIVLARGQVVPPSAWPWLSMAVCADNFRPCRSCCAHCDRRRASEKSAAWSGRQWWWSAPWRVLCRGRTHWWWA